METVVNYRQQLIRLLVLGGDKSMLLRFVRRLFSRKQLFSRKHVYSNYEGQRLSDSIEREILKSYFGF